MYHLKRYVWKLTLARKVQKYSEMYNKSAWIIKLKLKFKFQDVKNHEVN